MIRNPLTYQLMYQMNNINSQLEHELDLQNYENASNLKKEYKKLEKEYFRMKHLESSFIGSP